MPGDSLHAPWQTLMNSLPAGRIEIVKHVRTVLFDLRAQDLVQRGAPAQAMLACPDPLDVLVIAIGEKCPFGALINGQEDMSRRLPKIQKCIDLTGECRTIPGQFANPGGNEG